MDLGAWNQRLAEHFGALARDRKDIPVFALEHGLAQAELLALQNTLRAHIQVSAPARDHQLVWVVYAAEIGYGYAGNEYWQTFEDKTPGWRLNGRRDWIRDAFVAFQRKFAGAKPSGPWAEQFSIIAWPITHAILPCDLQQQLARILYELRHSFSGELFDEPQRLGDFIAARSWNTSARFQNLVQAPALVGQIAAALLLQGKEGFKTLLHPTTLKRIGDDVDRERRGRDWLRGARHAAEERAKIRGLTIGRSTNTTFQRREEAREEVARLGIEPRLVLRPIEGSRWEVSLEIPDLSHLLLRFPQVREVLTESRCTVAGAAGRPLARGRCLHGPQRVPLSRWPQPDDVLLKFERTDAQLEYLLRAECMLRPGTSWLFKVASDGLAYESRGMRVRADSKYLLVSTEPFANSPVARPVELACQGVHAALLDVPAALTSEWEQALKQFQVTQAKSIEVWPAGLAAVAWDGEGYGEWLASETPTLAIRSDHAMDELTIAMGDGPSPSLTLTDTPPGEAVFVELPPLPVGLHKFSVAARSGSSADSEVIGDLDVVMRVREARPWSPGSTAHGPLEMELDPAAPSLEQLWEGKAAVLVSGPTGRQLMIRVQMFVRAGEAPLFERQLPPVTLPLPSEEWTRHFEAYIKNDKSAQGAYDDTHVCEIELTADELGVFTFRCEREFTPLRWSLRRNSSGFIALLRDDADSDAPVIERYSFESPAVGEKLPSGVEHNVPRTGGLYVAASGDFKVAIVVPPVVETLADLQFEPQIDVRGRTVESVAQLLALARLWNSARHSGELVGRARQRLISRAIATRIASLIAGDNWSRCERDFSREEIGIGMLRRAIPMRRNQQKNGWRLITVDQIFPREILVRLAEAPLAERGAAFKDLAENILSLEREGSLLWLSEFALRMASAPGSLENWAGSHLEKGINTLLDAPSLACTARFLVLAVDQMRTVPTGADEIYAGWGWS
ncbi:hypothetical protein HW932_08535 [Allochromatium humboldtianum]|uniref:Uncharacterized protein n=1 Tax=Allochromatium humboldtianum TaxID=504901 RepID=A0A850R7J3_9GAMM|nr:hypothetical protein [Allochromatium humboldtianum]NVZ09308.1 hypothetical protein [Allochromatium humboldtianum]